MKSKISYKLILAVGSVTVAIIAIFSYFIINSQQQALIDQIEHNAHQISETIKSSTKYDMLLNRRAHVHRIIDTIGQQEGIEKIRIFNKEGEIIYSPDKSVIGSLVDKRAEACYACHAADQAIERLSIPERTRIFETENQVRNLGIINPIYNEPGCWQADCHAHEAEQKVLGVLDVTMSLEEVDQQISANQMKLVLFAISAIVGISLLLWFLVQKLVGKPVNQLVKATNIVAAGNLNYKIDITEDGELAHLGKSFNEMTHKLAEAQRQLYQSDKLASLGRLAAGVAHEINNPLTGVLTYSSFLLKRQGDDDEIREDLEVIVRETKRCREIVKGLLDFSRQAPTKKTNIPINDMITQTLGILKNQLSIKNISVQKDLSDDLPIVRVDSNQMQQVFMNLLVNAIDAIGKSGGEIKIRTSEEEIEDERFIKIDIADSGGGIAKENLTKIFEPFYSTKGQKGTGLGLAVVWGIIEKHHGKITVGSEEGKGTTFTIHIPVGEGATVLIEEDHHEQQM
ncbi:HAMP domain-containing protein [candidate division KSB1 bacterium]|nr:HAMP domain-containing protein [candidate division KSB1 bacterium]NIR72031.1 HAMP domain-containing protein [candidate division KSB1 bacterium]NIS25972.1 HAMP domain-containing protein [candidate division KSB1 bacterium]NIT74943.1 HAMP domain-containing protein [candidate division KSB1 bacterium]NIU28727.1 HAMP domain-containing protein [candidate division KSB1 bacterium]